MAYQRPLVMVFQEYARMGVSGGDTKLSPCIVGPCYHIVDINEDRSLSFVGRYQDLPDSSSVVLPNQRSGATLDNSSVTVRIENPLVGITSSPISVSDVTDNVVTVAMGDFNSDVEVGDQVVVKDDSGTTVISGHVLDINSSEYKYQLTRSADTPLSTGTVEFFREMETYEATPTVNEDDTLDISGVIISTYSLVGGNVFVGYRSLRTDLLDINNAGTITEASGSLGKLDTHNNPLGLGVRITLQNTNTEVRYVGIREDNATGYAEAQSLLESSDQVYGLVPLTQDVAVKTAFSNHVSQMSTPDAGAWRVVFLNSPLPSEIVKEDGTGLPKEDISGNLLLWKDTNASYITEEVMAGDTLILTSGATDYEYTISGVVTEDTLLVDSETEIDNTAFQTDSSTPYSYKVVASNTKLAQANEVANIAKSYNNRRAVHIWPDEVMISDEEGFVPGYYMGCAIAGATAGLPSHHGFTRLSIGGIKRIKNSNDYFSREQLDTIAEGGNFILTQENNDAPVVIRHQLTTDMSTLEFREFSFVKNFDYVSIICREVLDNFIGQYNITPSTLGALDTAIRSVMDSLKLNSLPKIGSPIMGYSIDSIHQLDSERDRVEIYVGVDFPNALNRIGLHLVSQ